MNAPLRKLLEPDEVAPFFGYKNRVSFLRMVRESGVPHIRLNERRVMFDPEAVNGWLRDRTVGGRRHG